MVEEGPRLVTGAGGFIGHHLVTYLKSKGFWVRGVDLRKPKYQSSPADEFLIADLRNPEECRRALLLSHGDTTGFDEIYHLAADMGGMGFINSAESEIMRNNALIDINMIDSAAQLGVRKYFFSSSVCVYRDMVPGEPEITEDDVYPALPDNEYGWEKLYAERTATAFGRRFGMQIRIARFQNCYGPEGAWTGGREKAPAAICRKVAEMDDGGSIKVWGDGSAVRSYTYIDDMVDGIFRLMHSSLEGPVNIGSPEYVTVQELVDTVIDVSGKRIGIQYVDGPVGVQSRNFSNERIFSLGWKPQVSLREGIEHTYAWIADQVRALRTSVS